MGTENVVVIGASANEERYSNKAMKMLADYGHHPIPVAPAAGTILGRPVYSRPDEVVGPVDTVTMYVGAARQLTMYDAIVALNPRRVIFNPGSENPEFYDRLKAAGIEPVEACTLVLLRTGQY